MTQGQGEASRGHKILIMGLPGSGKTTLAQALLRHIPAVHWNGDTLRECPWAFQLGWSVEDRWKQAERMNWLARETNDSGVSAICDFICPRVYCRDLFAEGGPKPFVIWCDRGARRSPEYKNTYDIWQAPGLVSNDPVHIHLQDQWNVKDEAEKIAVLLDNGWVG